jgi:predicted nucleotidyltransferase
MTAIHRLARQIAEQFQPERILLFGSYAYGEPHRDSDVDLLVVMEAKDPIVQAIRIRRATEHPFPLDILVRTPEEVRWRTEEGDSFLCEVLGKGKVLYEKANEGMGSKGRGRLNSGAENGRTSAAST